MNVKEDILPEGRADPMPAVLLRAADPAMAVLPTAVTVPLAATARLEVSGGYGQEEDPGRRQQNMDPHLRAAANYIRSGHYQEALNVLEGIKERNALWYFYSASANSGLGNNVTALEHAREAVRLEPENTQYRMLLERLEGGGAWYQQRQTMYGYPGSFDSSCCVKLCVANLLCNLCCGGGRVLRRLRRIRRLWRLRIKRIPSAERGTYG